MNEYAELIEARFDLIRDAGGANHLVCCPFHDERTPSLSVNYSSGLWKCWGCGEVGDIYKLIAKTDSADYEDVVALIDGDVTGIGKTVVQVIDEITGADETVRKVVNKKAFDKLFIPCEESDDALQYLTGRGVNDITMKQFDLRYGAGKWKNRVIVPIYDDTCKLVAFSGRTVIPNHKPKVKKHGNYKRTLFGIHTLALEVVNILLLVEGEFDAMSLQQRGYPAVATMGTGGLSEEQKRQIFKYARRVVLSYDPDAAGLKATDRDKVTLREYLPVEVVELPEGKDPDELTDREVKDLYGVYV